MYHNVDDQELNVKKLFCTCVFLYILYLCCIDAHLKGRAGSLEQESEKNTQPRMTQRSKRVTD